MPPCRLTAPAAIAMPDGSAHVAAAAPMQQQQPHNPQASDGTVSTASRQHRPAPTSGVELGLLLGRLGSGGSLLGVRRELAAVLLLDGPQAAAARGRGQSCGARRRRASRRRSATSAAEAAWGALRGCRALLRDPGIAGVRLRRLAGAPGAAGSGQESPLPMAASGLGRAAAGAASCQTPWGTQDMPGLGPGRPHVPAWLHGRLHGALGGPPPRRRPSATSIPLQERHAPAVVALRAALADNAGRKLLGHGSLPAAQSGL